MASIKLVRKLIILLAVLLLIFTGGSIIQAKKYEIAEFDIDMELMETGDYVVTERITYNFKEGSFTRGYREIKGKGFKELKFVSIRGVDQQVSKYNLKEGRNLVINWEYPPAVGQNTFVIKYIARGGLLSRDGRNVIDWNPVGAGWEVPIRRVDIKINLPRQVENLDIIPRQDLLGVINNRVMTFRHDGLPRKTYYHLLVSFTEIIAMPEEGTPGGVPLIIIAALAAGLFYLIAVIIKGVRAKPEKVPVEIKPTDLSFIELAALYYPGDSQNKKRGISAQLFSLARAGKLKLISKLKKGSFNVKSTEVEVKVLSEEEVSIQEKLFINKLKKHDTLKKLMYDYKGLREITDSGDRALMEKGLLSEKKVVHKRGIFFSALYVLLAGIAVLLYGILVPRVGIIGIGVFLFMLFIGRLLKGSFTPVLSGKGIYLREKAGELLNEKKEKIDGLISQNPALALEFFFTELPYIVIHPKFTAATLHKYKKEFKKAEDFKIPDWIELDTSNLDQTLAALEMVEVIDYVLISTIFVAGTTGAAGISGAGAPGSGAGGGGGGAG